MAEVGHDGARPRRPVKGSSDRGFGFVIAAALCLLALLPLIAGKAPLWWLIPVAFALAIIAAVRPATLAPFNRWWTRLGLALHAVVSPIVLGVIFFLAVTPIGLVMRLFGHDSLHLTFRRGRESLWHRPADGATRSMIKQF